MSESPAPSAGQSLPAAPPSRPRTDDTPAHAHHPAVRLVPMPCPVFSTEAAWLLERTALVETGALHGEEAAMADQLPIARRGTFVGGRLALRAALLGALPTADIPPVLRTARGAPQLPGGVTGSISHKRDLALAAATVQNASVQHLGVDLERRPTAADLARPSIAHRILTATERAVLAAEALDPLRERERVLVHFAVKEAVYKAVDPFVGRYVPFAEVELHLHDGGTADVTLHLPEPIIREVRVAAQWYVDGAWIVATAFSRTA